MTKLGLVLLGLVFGIGLTLLIWDQIDCLIYPGTDWCLGCAEDCLDPLISAEVGK